MKIFSKLLLIIFIVLYSLECVAQDPHFSQFHANPMYLNPAYTGANFCPRVIMNYRNQWSGQAADYLTYNSSFDFGLDEIHGGLGLVVSHDRQGWGVLNTTNIALLYSYHAKLSGTTTLSAGFQVGYFERQLDSDQDFGYEIHPIHGFIFDSNDPYAYNAKASYTDLGIGILLNTNNYFFGAAVHHFREPTYSFFDVDNPGKLPMKITVHGGSRIVVEDLGWFNSTFLSKFSVLTPHFLFHKQAESEQINLGGTLSSDHLGLGLSYRRNFSNSDALIILLGYELEKYKIGYSYDLTISKLGISSGGSHEISLQIQLGCFYKKPSQNTIPCPKF